MKIITLTQGYEAIVDDDCFDELNQRRWKINKSKGKLYAVRNYFIKYEMGVQKTGTLQMHRVIAGAKDGEQVDHINGNGLDNRRENLRLCGQKENIHNSLPYGSSSSYKGVSRSAKDQKWRAQIVRDGKCTCIGRYDTEDEAAAAYNAAAIELRGEYARLNVIGAKRTEAATERAALSR